MNLFYAPDFNLDIDISKNFDSRSWSLNKQESHHAVHVLRLNINSPVEITNGKGGFFSGVISKTDSKVCQIQILSAKIIEPRPYYIRILIAPTKNSDRFEWFLEKSTEIGVDEIIPLYCQNSERKVFNQERMEKVVIASMKQSGQAYLPKIHPLENFSTFSSKNLEGTGLIAHCREGKKNNLKTIFGSTKQKIFNILIGPEGDFSKEEVEVMVSKGYIPISLGKSRLRTETAALFVVARFSELAE